MPRQANAPARGRGRRAAPRGDANDGNAGAARQLAARNRQAMLHYRKSADQISGMNKKHKRLLTTTTNIENGIHYVVKVYENSITGETNEVHSCGLPEYLPLASRAQGAVRGIANTYNEPAVPPRPAARANRQEPAGAPRQPRGNAPRQPRDNEAPAPADRRGEDHGHPRRGSRAPSLGVNSLANRLSKFDIRSQANSASTRIFSSAVTGTGTGTGIGAKASTSRT